MNRIVFSLFLVITVIVLYPAITWGRYDPEWSWKVHRSDHFTLYYPKGHEDFAKRILDLESKVYEDVTGYLGVTPPHCPIVLNPGTDILNGFFSPFPNRISLYEVPFSSLRGFGPSSDMMKTIFTHEFSHFTHLTTRLGWYGKLSALFGRDSSITNILSPGWITEGVSTTAETVFSDGGRGRCSYFLGEILSFTEGEGLWNLSAAGVTPPFGPPGNRIYLSGYFMVDYINRTFGDDAISRLGRYQAMHPLGFSSEALEHVTGLPSAVFYSNFLDDMKKKAEEVNKASEKKGLPEGRLLFPLEKEDEKEEIADYFWTDKNTIIGLRTGYAKKNAFIEIDPSNNSITDVKKTGTINLLHRFSPTADKTGIIYAGYYPHLLGEGDLVSTDITRFDISTGRFHKLTKNKHILSVTSSPDGRTMAAVQRNGMWTDLVLLDAEGKNIRPLVSEQGLLFDKPVFSPDGKHLAVAVKCEKNADIVLVNTETGDLQFLFESDEHEDNDPFFSNDGKWILFSSNRSGMWNIFSWNIEEKKLYQLTSVPYGATCPALSQDGKTLSFSALHRGLRHLNILPFEPSLEIKVNIDSADTAEQFKSKAVSDQNITLKAGSFDLKKEYTPFLHIPYFINDEDDTRAGLLILGGDPVGLNTYQAFLDYGFSSEHTGYDIRFTNRSLWPDITLGLYNSSKKVSIPGYDFWIEEKGFELYSAFNMINRVVPDQISSSLMLGVRYKKLESLDRMLLIKNDKNEASSFFSQLTVKRAPDTPAETILPIWGQEGFFLYEKTISGLNSEIKAENSVVSLKQYLPAFSSHDGFTIKGVVQNQSGDMRFDKDMSLPRGYSSSDHTGGLSLSDNLLLSLEYHMPVMYPDKGSGLSLVHVHRLKSTLFSDWGAGWDKTFRLEEWVDKGRISLGGSLRAEASIFSIIPVEIGLELGIKTKEKDGFSNIILMLGF